MPRWPEKKQTKKPRVDWRKRRQEALERYKREQEERMKAEEEQRLAMRMHFPDTLAVLKHQIEDDETGLKSFKYAAVETTGPSDNPVLNITEDYEQLVEAPITDGDFIAIYKLESVRKARKAIQLL